MKGANNSVNYKFRMHDPRIGRFFAVDPLAASYPHNSPYAFSENVVINSVELEGKEKTEAFMGGTIRYSDGDKTFETTFAIVINFDMNSLNFQMVLMEAHGMDGANSVYINSTDGNLSCGGTKGQTLPERFNVGSVENTSIAGKAPDGLISEIAIMFDVSSIISKAILETEFVETYGTILEKELQLPPTYVDGSLSKIMEMAVYSATELLEGLSENDQIEVGITQSSTENEIKSVPTENGGRKIVEYEGGIQYGIETTDKVDATMGNLQITLDKILVTFTSQTKKEKPKEKKPSTPAPKYSDDPKVVTGPNKW